MYQTSTNKDVPVCRICKSDLIDVLSLGDTYISDFVKNVSELSKMELVMSKCSKCGLVQIKDTPELDSMYKKYWYKSGINNTMSRDLKDITTKIEQKIKLRKGNVVVDIGTNDGTLLTHYTKKVTKVGFDPATSISETAKKNCDYFINDYFSAENYPKDLPKAKIITAIAMFYDLPDPNSFIDDMKSILDKNGIIVIQFTDLLSTLKINAIDNLCFEHIELYKLLDLYILFNKHGLSIFDLEYNHVNGGSLRVYISNGNYPINPIVLTSIVDEGRYFYGKENPLQDLKDRIEYYSSEIKKYIYGLKENGKTICALGASTKGNTLLQVMNFDDSIISYVGEINDEKFGLKTVTGIPIISEKEVLDMKPDLLVILPWHFRETFVKVTESYIKNGGVVLYPLPVPVLVFSSRGKFEARFL